MPKYSTIRASLADGLVAYAIVTLYWSLGGVFRFDILVYTALSLFITDTSLLYSSAQLSPHVLAFAITAVALLYLMRSSTPTLFLRLQYAIGITIFFIIMESLFAFGITGNVLAAFSRLELIYYVIVFVISLRLWQKNKVLPPNE